VTSTHGASYIRGMRNLITLALAAIVSTACVSKGDYELLQKDRDKLKAELASTQQKLNETETARQATARELQKLIDVRDGLQRDLQGASTEKASLKSSVDEMQRAMQELAARKAEADKRIAEFKSLAERFKKLIDAGKLRVKTVDGRMVVELATDILFDSGSASLSKGGKAAIIEVATVLKDIPDRSFQIEGHTDDVPMKGGAYASNWELASARAINVVKALVEGQMAPERLSAASFSQFKPAKANDTKEGKAANRRIEIVLVPDLSSLPGFDELQKASSN
jgi:chemotaxis protein MotB